MFKVNNKDTCINVPIILELKVHQCRFKNFTVSFGFIEKQYPENFTFLILRSLELFIREVVFS